MFLAYMSRLIDTCRSTHNFILAMAGLSVVFAGFERNILRERVRAGLALAQRSGKRLGRTITAGLRADKVRKLHRGGVTKAEIARRLQIGPRPRGRKRGLSR